MNDYTDLPAIFGQSPYASYDSQEVKAYINLNFDGITAGNCSIALLPLVSLPPSADNHVRPHSYQQPVLLQRSSRNLRS